MEMVEELTAGAARRPTGRLRPFIRRYVGSRIEGLEPGEHGGLPSPFLTLIVGIDSAIDVVAMPDRRQAPGSVAAILGGLHTCAATVAYGASLSCVNVELSPLGARSLLGVRAGELASRVVALEDVLGRRGVELPERLAHAGSWPQRFDVLDMAFAAGLTDRLALSPPLGRAWRRIVSSGGAARIDAVAAEVGWSRRNLLDRFRVEFGLSPKVAARVVRFDRARRLLEHPVGPSAAMVAARCGYHDQAHLTREWQDLGGCPPGAWLAAEQLPNVQDALQ